MRGWAGSVRHTLASSPIPLDDPRTHASGVDAGRVLVLGTGAAVGWGVLSHNLALPGALARAISRLTRRGTDVDVIADPRMRASTAIHALREVHLDRYDAIVLTLGLNEATEFVAIRRWRRELGELLDHLATRAPALQIFVLGVHAISTITTYDALMRPLASQHRSELNRASWELSELGHRAVFVPFESDRPAHQHRSATTRDYDAAALQLATRMAPALDATFGSAGIAWRRDLRSGHADEVARQEAVDSVGLLDTPPEERFDNLVAFARRLFHTNFAALTIIDHDRQWQKSIIGLPNWEVAREFSICATTIMQSGELVVPDATMDARFSGIPIRSDRAPVRFYAGFPIEAPNGQRIGALCVFDADPRAAAEVDRSLLRDVALLVQREVWRGGPTSTSWG